MTASIARVERTSALRAKISSSTEWMVMRIRRRAHCSEISPLRSHPGSTRTA
ncbi:hypothetical protein ACFWPQ_49215 [Streptomyces sp. NPDC058464]|uniref:hypothetical protein n=1 Tax=Streptomyces sp. NPDC058464 TaxID=3346511 RepID=UPI003665C58E